MRGTAGLRAIGAGVALIAAAAAGVAPAAPNAAPHRAPLAAASAGKPASSSPKVFELTSESGSGKPVRWLACKPIEYRINPAGMPAGMTPVVQRVMRTVARQTGARFRYAGRTTHGFTSDSHARTPTIYVAFTGKAHVAKQSFSWPGQIGVGGPAAGWYLTDSGSTFEAVTYGRVLLSTRFHGTRIGPGVTWEALILHEVGHALNLEHRSSPTAVMHASLTSRSPARFTTGEVEALKRTLQTSGCDYAAWSKL